MQNTPVLDTLVGGITVVTTAMATALLTITTAPVASEELQLLLLPLIGALIASGGMIMLNPTPETRRIVIGRAVFSLFLGTVSPQITALALPSWATFLSHPVVLLAAGGVLSMIFYALSRPFTERLYVRSKDIADAAVSRAENALVGTVRQNVREVMRDVVEEKVAPLINDRADAIEAKQDKPKRP